MRLRGLKQRLEQKPIGAYSAPSYKKTTKQRFAVHQDRPTYFGLNRPGFSGE